MVAIYLSDYEYMSFRVFYVLAVNIRVVCSILYCTNVKLFL